MNFKKIVSGTLGLLLVTSSIQSSPYTSLAKDLEKVPSNIENSASNDKKKVDNKNLDNLSSDKLKENSSESPSSSTSNDKLDKNTPSIENKEKSSPSSETSENKDKESKKEDKSDKAKEDKADNKIDKADSKENKADSKENKADSKKNTPSSINKENIDKKTDSTINKEEVKKAKEDLKAYLDSINADSIDNPSVKFEDENIKAQIKASIARAKELLNDENIDKDKLSEIQKFPFKKVNGKKQGLLRDYTHKALVDYEILGERNNINPHTNKGYTALKDNKFTIKTSLKDLKKSGQGKNFLRINYVTEEDYNKTKVDAVSGSTPKYKKQELKAENYTIKEVEGGYEVTINKLPEGVKFIKPIVLVELANKTYFENGDLVYVKSDQAQAPATPSDKISEDKVNPKAIESAKKEFKAYLESINEDAIENSSVNYTDKNVKEQIKAAIKRAKELLNDENIDKDKLLEIQKFPFKKVNGKKQGLLRDYTHKALVDYEILGERNNINPHTNKGYTALKDNKFTIKTSLKDLKKSGQGKNFLRINYVTEEDYNKTKVDAVSGSTPKYKKQELKAENYTIKEVEGGYEVTINKLPEGVKFIKPIVLVELANKTYFENGDLVYVKSDQAQAPAPQEESNEVRPSNEVNTINKKEESNKKETSNKEEQGSLKPLKDDKNNKNNTQAINNKNQTQAVNNKNQTQAVNNKNQTQAENIKNNTQAENSKNNTQAENSKNNTKIKKSIQNQKIVSTNKEKPQQAKQEKANVRTGVTSVIPALAAVVASSFYLRKSKKRK